jgi:hypothetical protein
MGYIFYCKLLQGFCLQKLDAKNDPSTCQLVVSLHALHISKLNLANGYLRTGALYEK